MLVNVDVENNTKWTEVAKEGFKGYPKDGKKKMDISEGKTKVLATYLISSKWFHSKLKVRYGLSSLQQSIIRDLFSSVFHNIQHNQGLGKYSHPL